MFYRAEAVEAGQALKDFTFVADIGVSRVFELTIGRTITKTTSH
jgi:hypothetical protein